MHKLQNVYYVIGTKCYKRKYQFNDYDIFIRDIFNQEKIKKENRKDFTVQYYNKSKEKWCTIDKSNFEVLQYQKEKKIKLCLKMRNLICKVAQKKINSYYLHEIDSFIIIDDNESKSTNYSNNPIKQNNANNEIIRKEDTIHLNIQCNECKISSIRGIRYKCYFCSLNDIEYNLCSKCKDKLSSLSFHPHTYYIPIQDSESFNSSLKALQLVSKVPFDVVITNPNKVFTCELSESSIQYLTLDNITYEYK